MQQPTAYEAFLSVYTLLRTYNTKQRQTCRYIFLLVIYSYARSVVVGHDSVFVADVDATS